MCARAGQVLTSSLHAMLGFKPQHIKKWNAVEVRPCVCARATGAPRGGATALCAPARGSGPGCKAAGPSRARAAWAARWTFALALYPVSRGGALPRRGGARDSVPTHVALNPKTLGSRGHAPPRRLRGDRLERRATLRGPGAALTARGIRAPQARLRAPQAPRKQAQSTLQKCPPR